MTDYTLVFDVMNASLDLRGVAITFLLTLIMAVVVVYEFRTVQNHPGALRFALASAGLICSVLFTLLAWFVANYSLSRAQQILGENRALVVEGPGENFKPQPDRGRGQEEFTVGGIQFGYSEHSGTPGFHTPAVRGGPIRQGLWVRIHFAPHLPDGVQSTILRLEIRE